MATSLRAFLDPEPEAADNQVRTTPGDDNPMLLAAQGRCAVCQQRIGRKDACLRYYGALGQGPSLYGYFQKQVLLMVACAPCVERVTFTFNWTDDYDMPEDALVLVPGQFGFSE